MATREKIQLSIPVNLKTKTEFFEGYGLQEFLQNLVIACIGIIIALIFYFFSRNDFISIIIAFIFIAGGFFLTVKDTFTLSLLDQFRIAFEFRKTQKTYHYKYGGGLNEFIQQVMGDHSEEQETK